MLLPRDNVGIEKFKELAKLKEDEKSSRAMYEQNKKELKKEQEDRISSFNGYFSINGFAIANSCGKLTASFSGQSIVLEFDTIDESGNIPDKTKLVYGTICFGNDRYSFWIKRDTPKPRSGNTLLKKMLSKKKREIYRIRNAIDTYRDVTIMSKTRYVLKFNQQSINIFTAYFYHQRQRAKYKAMVYNSFDSLLASLFTA